MVTSACQVLIDEPERFLDYLLSDPNMRNKIVDDKSFIEVATRVFKSDPTLANILATINRSGESLEICGKNILNEKAIQDIINNNQTKRRVTIEQRVRRQRPKLKGKQLTKEIDRRLKISISGQAGKIRQSTTQVTIEQSLKPVAVGGYVRNGKTIKPYRKSKYKKLNKQEEMLLDNAIKRGKSLSDVYKVYLESGLGEGFRTKTSLKRQYERRKLNFKP